MEGFNWHVQRVDGHDMKALDKAISNAKEVKDKPSMIIMDTIKGKGCSFAEGVLTNHNMHLLMSRQKKPSACWKGKILMSDTRDLRVVYAETLKELAEKDNRICVVEADLMLATGTGTFKADFPERTFDVGVAEANMVGVASGLAAAGKIPWAASFGCFSSRRAFDQFFLSGNYSGLKVKLVGTDPGVSAAFNGGTHMPFEDIALMRTIPGLTIIEPCDRRSLAELIKQASYLEGSVYMRLHRKRRYEHL